MDTADFIDDPNERPTLPSPTPDAEERAAAMRAFDTQSEVFFSSTATLPGAAPQEPDADDLRAWWIEQRRRTLVGWVAAAVALCATVLLAGVLYSPPQ